MVPGDSECPTGWHILYNGWLMTSATSKSSATSNICVDIENLSLGDSTHPSATELTYVKTMETVARDTPCVVCSTS